MKNTLLFVLLFTMSCTGEIFFGDSDLRVSDKNSSFQNTDQNADPIIINTNDNSNPGTVPSNSNNGVQPDPVTKNAYLLNASSGSRCNAGGNLDYIILSDSAVSCEAHANAIDAHQRNETVPGLVVFDADALNFVKKYCFTDVAKGCVDVSFQVARNGASGSWTATIEGRKITQPFNIQTCDYDSVVAPPDADIPATDISITEVSFYQGVKVPVFENGQFVSNRSAPIIAKRRGVVRVFVEPLSDWTSREIRARLTVGDFTKDMTFTPNGKSQELSGGSTINFELAEGELPGEGDFSVSLYEIGKCGDNPPGTVAVSRIPSTRQALGAKTLAAPMRIMLVPMMYNADGTGRTPRVDAGVLQAWEKLANEYFPVHDVQITVRDQPVPYNGQIFSNGSGFSQALNYCLNQRNADNVASDVYYYCMYQPVQTLQEFCGRGCVAGIAPVPNASDVSLRGGMGVSFNGSGDDTFVHEIGHALGRPHTPCGGAAGADPNYPYQGGSIGSIGYSIASGELYSPAQAKDFMSYCSPVWISDYSYAKIYDRLSQVLGLQQNQFLANPITWKTAIREMDGSVNWDIDRTMKTTPSGTLVSGDVFDGTNKKVGSVEVYVLPVADIETSILTIEDPGFTGGRIDIPNIGSLTF